MHYHWLSIWTVLASPVGRHQGTLKGIQDDLLMDDEVVSVRFSAQMLEWFDDLQREFVLKHGGDFC